MEKAPVQDLERPYKAALEVEPALADKRVRLALRLGQLGEDFEEDFVG